MSDSKKDSVTQADFMLFKQEMKHEFQLFQESMSNKFDLYLSKIDSKTADIINKRLDILGKWVLAVGTIFVVGFFTYFEIMRTKVDQVNSDRIALMENFVYASQMDMMGLEKQKHNRQSPLSKDKKIKRVKK